MALALSIVGLLTALVPLLVWWLRSRGDANPQQRADARERAIAECEAEVARLEARGDFAAADALRRSVLDRATAEHRAAGLGEPGQQLPPRAASGDGNLGPGSGNR